MVGFGVAGQAHVSGYAQREDVAIVAVVDPSPERRAAARWALPTARVYATLDDLAREMHPDFLDICCPPRWHSDAVVKGLEMGCHILCEKPLFPTSVDSERVSAALKGANGVLYPCHNYKFAPALRRMREVVMSKPFGPVALAQFRVFRTSHAAGTSGWNPDWRRNSEFACGGILQDHGTHAVYLMRYLTGLAPLWVECETSRSSSSVADTEDTALVTVGLECDAKVTIALTWAALARHTSYTVIGSHESVSVDGSRFVHQKHDLKLASVVTSDFDNSTHSSWFGALFDDFRDLIMQPTRQGELMAEAHLAAVVIASAYRSAAYGGERIELS
jgi:predicted dehydrogenase